MTSSDRRGRRWLVAAGVAGTLHGAASVYWGLGGDLLVWSLGRDLVEAFRDLRWVLVPLGVVKVVAAWVPLLLAARGWPWSRLWRPASWLGAGVLVAWGGANTVVAHLVLAGAVRPGGGYDRPGMIGHAWLWDPLFLVWGACLAVGLWRSRRSR